MEILIWFHSLFRERDLSRRQQPAHLDGDPYAFNRVEFDNGRLIAREVSVSGVPPCGGKLGIYELRLLQGGSLQIVVIKDTCGPRAGDTQGIYERVP